MVRVSDMMYESGMIQVHFDNTVIKYKSYLGRLTFLPVHQCEGVDRELGMIRFLSE